MSKECYRCKTPIDWDGIEWNYFEVMGYRSKINRCSCGHKQSKHEPFSKEKKALWQTLVGHLKSTFGVDQ